MAPEIEENIRAYFESKTEVIAVYLFGSYAAGKQHRTSDLDIGILLDGTARDFFCEKRDAYLVELSRIVKKDIHPVILNSGSEELLRQVFLKGTCLQVNNEKKLTAYKMVMYARIAEFAYYRKQLQSGLIRKIMREGTIG
ncbi:nucleotidyltransferase domain-containing protein [Thermodesulfobacteriota bacterium]